MKNSLSLLIICLIPLIMTSQTFPLKYGIKAGWNYSNVDAIDDLGEKSGYISSIIDEAYAGLVVEKQIGQKSYVQSGLIFSFTESVNFIELPIFYKYNFLQNFSFLIGPKIEYIPDKQFNNNYFFKRRFGFSANLGLDYQLSKKWILEAYYSKAFVKQYDDWDLDYYDSKRNVYRIGVSYFFN